MSLSVNMSWSQLEFKRVCYLVDMISCYGEASEVVSGRLGSTCVSPEKGFIFEATRGDLSVLC